jgi:hypothetical protein
MAWSSQEARRREIRLKGDSKVHRFIEKASEGSAYDDGFHTEPVDPSGGINVHTRRLRRFHRVFLLMAEFLTMPHLIGMPWQPAPPWL